MESGRFTLCAFLRDRLVVAAVAICLLVLVAVTLAVLGVSPGGIIVIELALSTSGIALVAYEYLRRRRFWRELETLADALDAAEYFGDIAPQADFLEGRLALDAATAVSRQASDEIAGLRNSAQAHSEYIDLWVHEVKTPLAAARLVVDKMRGPDAAKLRQELERMESLIQQVLFTARSSSLSDDYLIREVRLLDVVRDACKSNMNFLTSCNVTLDLRIDPSVTVLADKTWLAFIVSQVVVNSAKYDASRITVTATEPAEESSSSNTVLSITDDGYGIPASDVPRVFDRGFTGEVGRAHGSATGMGLYLSAQMCERMGLGISLTSEQGTGTRIEIAFPHDRRRLEFERANLTQP